MQEAHADDTWPLGFGINSTHTVEDRWNNCQKQLGRLTQFAGLMDLILNDTIANDFNEATGAWPEAYYHLNKDGVCQWHTTPEFDCVYKLKEYFKGVGYL